MERKGRAEMEGCKTIFGGDNGRERLREICLIGPVRTGWREQTEKNISSKWKMDKDNIYMTGQLWLEYI